MRLLSPFNSHEAPQAFFESCAYLKQFAPSTLFRFPLIIGSSRRELVESFNTRTRFLVCTLLSAIAFATSTGCKKDSNGDGAQVARPVVYCSVDEQFAREIITKFEAETGIKAEVVFDSEAGKTTGLVNRIIDEGKAGRRRADVFWSGELFNTILLGRQGLLEPYKPSTADDIPERYRDPGHHWTATGVRGRVLAFDPKVTPADQVPTSWTDLADPGVAGRTALANPLFGTTRGHVAAMFALWGSEKGRAFLEDLRRYEVRIVDGNMTAVRNILDGRVAFAATDTDDVWVVQRRGASIDLRYLDMGDGGTLLIPSTTALLRGSTNPDARRLVDFLVSAEVERLLAKSAWGSVPVRPWLREELGMEWPAESKVDHQAVADSMDEAVQAVREILIR